MVGGCAVGRVVSWDIRTDRQTSRNCISQSTNNTRERQDWLLSQGVRGMWPGHHHHILACPHLLGPHTLTYLIHPPYHFYLIHLTHYSILI